MSIRFYSPGQEHFGPDGHRDIMSHETASLTHPITRRKDGSLKMEMYIDVHRFTHEEVKVDTRDGKIIVAASREHRTDHGDHHTHSFKRELTIPKGVDVRAMTAALTEEGGLLIEAPVDQSAEATPEAVPFRRPSVSLVTGEVTHEEAGKE